MKRSDGKPNQKRQYGIDGWVKARFVGDDRIAWDELWLGMCSLVGARTKCSRDSVGAVIVSADNRLLSVGYNGPPAGFVAPGSCVNWCHRAQAAVSGNDTKDDYSDCPSLHAESNSLLRLSVGSDAIGSTIYVNSAVCIRCALMIAGSKVSRVVIQTSAKKSRERNLDRSVSLLMGCGIEVIVITGRYSGVSYRAKFLEEFGFGPHKCYFCDEAMIMLETVHHKDHNHSNDDIGNLTAAHRGCHVVYHTSKSGAGGDKAKPAVRSSVTTKWERKKPMLACTTCGAKMTPGWLERHCRTYDHDDDGQVEAYRLQQKKPIL